MNHLRLMLAGHVGKDPEIKEIKTGKMAIFSVAYTEKWKDRSGQKVENTEWYNIIAFKGAAEIVSNYIRKGDNVFIESSKIKNSSYEKNGQKVYTSQIIADSVKKIRSAKGGDTPSQTKSETPSQAKNTENENEDVPF